MHALQLSITDYRDDTAWRWQLADANGRFLADHQVELDPSAPEYRGLLDLRDWLDFYRPVKPPVEQLRDLGAWIGAQVFGGLARTLLDEAVPPATAVHVHIPAAARALLQRPFELARLEGRAGPTLGELGLRLVYHPEGLPDGSRRKDPPEPALRILCCFSLPDRQNPLNLRRERQGIQRLARELTQARGRAIELRVIQYGATRATLRDALEEAPGWDLIHLSGHGGRGTLVLERADGSPDPIEATELGKLLRPTRGRLKLLILDACWSGAASHQAARASLGLPLDPTRDAPDGAAAAPAATQSLPTEKPPAPPQGAAPGNPAAVAATALPSLAEDLARGLDCAALAMRFPVGDGFATDLMLALYDRLLDRGQPLPAALGLALQQALAGDDPARRVELDGLPLSAFTPVLLGPRAAALSLAPPQRPAGSIALPPPGLAAFPSEPERFVGRLGPMLRASRILAPEGKERGLIFYGIAGAGKTACALELAYRHERERFAAQVWYQGPQQGQEIVNALGDLLRAIEHQLGSPDLNLGLYLDQPAQFKALVLPRLKALLEQNALLLVLDNLEHLLTDAGDWRDPLWGEVMATLAGHRGLSRVVLTARRLPRDLQPGGALAAAIPAEPIHALSLAESVLLARELPNLAALFADAAGRALLTGTLRVIQGHPKLLELADGLAADRAALAAQVAAVEAAQADRDALLDAFFAPADPAAPDTRAGESAQPEAGFVATLHRWTRGVAARLDPQAALLLAFLCRLEPEDRALDLIQTVWPHFLERLQTDAAADLAADPRLGQAVADALARAAPGQGPGLDQALAGLDRTLAGLAGAGLVEVEREAPDPERLAEIQAQILAQLQQQLGDPLPEGLDLDALLARLAAGQTRYRIHPGVAEAVLADTPPAVAAAADTELGDYHRARYRQASQTETQGSGEQIVDACRRGLPYLLRRGRWDEASMLIEQMTKRDERPETLAWAIPLLRRICAATADGERGLEDAGVLAKVLWKAGRSDEAEREQRRIIAAAVAAGAYRTASAAAGNLLNLLRDSGRWDEALALAKDMAGYSRRAGLGPWTQLAAEGRRLQILVRLGRSDEVLSAVEELRGRMAALPEEGDADETVRPWNVREALLDTGCYVAQSTGNWQQALDLNADRLASQRERGAGALEQAATRFNDYGPLLRLGRLADCERLLQGCRAVFEGERHLAGLGKVYSALADLQDEAADPAHAVGFEQVALRYKYHSGDPQDCAISHNNLANHLERTGADPALVIAHRAAAAMLGIQMGAGQLATSLRSLALTDLPDAPPPFAQLADTVEQVEGVRFRALFAQLPANYPVGDAALAAVWRQVARLRAQWQAGGDPAALALFDDLLGAIAAVARGEHALSDDEDQDLTQLLDQLEQSGWRVRDPIRRVLAGERDPAALTAGLDAQHTALIQRLLALVDASASPPWPDRADPSATE